MGEWERAASQTAAEAFIAKIEALRARVAELERDAARLDAIERGVVDIYCDSGEWFALRADAPFDAPSSRGPALRAAIDAATGGA